jgi:hypothetical protein
MEPYEGFAERFEKFSRVKGREVWILWPLIEDAHL